MSTITIRNVDPELKRQLRIRAATSGHSMEEEADRPGARVRRGHRVAERQSRSGA